MADMSNVLPLLAMGFSMFPCKPGSKEPDTYDGFYSATKNEALLRDWFGGRKNRNIGIATGDASKVVVIDYDAYKHGSSFRGLELKLGDLPPTLAAKTRAGGYHLFFRFPEGHDLRSWNGTLGVGIDLRGNKGYVIGVGSYVDADKYGPAGGYTWEPETQEIAMLPDKWVELWESLNDEKLRKKIRKDGI